MEQLTLLRKVINIVEDDLLPLELGKGLDTLSEDVLSMIFEYVDERPTLLRVSRRFNRIALGTPYLWRSIDCKMPTIGHVIESLKQSKAVGLEVDLRLSPSESADGFLDVHEVLDHVLPHKRRWKTLSIKLIQGEMSTKINERLSSLHLPRLTSLTISYEDEEDYDPESFFHHFRSIQAPSLQRLRIQNFIPQSMPGAPMLSSVKIELHNITLVGDTFRDLAIFLSSTPLLEVFDLSLKRLGVEEVYDIPIVVLPNLQTLRIDVEASICPQLAPFREAIITPAIRKMHWIIRDGYNGPGWLHETGWLGLMLCHDEYPTLQEFYFKFDWYDVQCRRPTYYIPFGKLPSLRTLTLDTPCILPYSDKFGRIPALHSLCLRGCDSQWMSWIEQAHDRLREQGDLEGLQNITINKVNRSMKELVKEVFGGRKIRWHNGNEGEGID